MTLARMRVAEWMDDPALRPGDHDAALDGLARRHAQRGTAQIGVDDDAGGVDNAPQRRLTALLQIFDQPVDQHGFIGRALAFLNSCPACVQQTPQPVSHLFRAKVNEQCRHFGPAQECIYTGQFAVFALGIGHWCYPVWLTTEDTEGKSTRSFPCILCLPW